MTVKRILAATLLLTAALLGACGARSQVAGSTGETLYGYVQEINEQTRTVLVDEVELRSGEGGRPYVYNVGRAAMLYPLAERVDYDFADAVEGEPNGENDGNNDNKDNSDSGMSRDNGGADSMGGDAGGMLGGAGNADAADADRSYHGGVNNSNVGYSHESNDYYGGSGEVGGNSGAMAGNSVSGNTTVGHGTASGSGSMQSNGYAYRNVQGGLFSTFSRGADRLTAYADRYTPLLCRLQLQDGQVVSITVCTEANMPSADKGQAGADRR